jgi:hypothetical protein
LLRLLLWPLIAALEWDNRRNVVDRYGDIMLVEPDPDRRRRDLFATSVRDALDMIVKVDPRRFRMVRRYLDSIISARLAGHLGEYTPCFRACRVDVERHGLQWGGEARPWCVARLAATLIHEATHGRISEAGFAYTEETRAMIERLCWTEGRRFAERLCRQRPEFTHSVVSAFHVYYWSRAWHSTWWERVRQAHRATMRGRRAGR